MYDDQLFSLSYGIYMYAYNKLNRKYQDTSDKGQVYDWIYHKKIPMRFRIFFRRFGHLIYWAMLFVGEVTVIWMDQADIYKLQNPLLK